MKVIFSMLIGTAIGITVYWLMIGLGYAMFGTYYGLGTTLNNVALFNTVLASAISSAGLNLWLRR